MRCENVTYAYVCVYVLVENTASSISLILHEVEAEAKC